MSDEPVKETEHDDPFRVYFRDGTSCVVKAKYFKHDLSSPGDVDFFNANGKVVMSCNHSATKCVVLDEQAVEWV